MRAFYDMHIHSDLSPCGDIEMTPNNIVNMSYIKGLNIISVTDHNCALNHNAIKSLGSEIGIEVVPGIEVNTKEDVHILCYFKNSCDLLEFSDIIYESLPNIMNKSDIFGPQNVYDEDDNIIGQVDKLLLSASKLSVSEVHKLAVNYNGIIIPAHIDKKSNGILGVLGFFPFDIQFDYIELSKAYKENTMNEKLIKKYDILRNSDAHRLEAISEPENSFEVEKIDDIYSVLHLN